MYIKIPNLTDATLDFLYNMQIRYAITKSQSALING